MEETRDRATRLEDADPKVFIRAYQELRESVRIAKEEFENTAIYSGLKRALDSYTPRYESLDPIHQLL